MKLGPEQAKESLLNVALTKEYEGVASIITNLRIHDGFRWYIDIWVNFYGTLYMQKITVDDTFCQYLELYEWCRACVSYIVERIPKSTEHEKP